MKKRWVLLVAVALVAMLAVSAPVFAATIVRVATLSGANEVPGPGDPDGTGMANVRITLSDSRLCYTVRVNNIGRATMAHIHRGNATVAGPIVVRLRAPASGMSSGCRTVGRALLGRIARNPSAYYVNVHNAEFPNGAVRGQLRAR